VYTTLITAEQLAAAAHADGPGTRWPGDWLIVDCRFDLAKPEAGALAYAAGHIPTALYAHLDHDLSGPITASSGRHPLPSATALEATLRRWGVTADTQVVGYDADSGVYAARLWWLLRWVGLRRVAVLDGGLRAWSAQLLPITGEPSAARAPSQFRAVPDDSRWLDTPAVAEHRDAADWCLLDARAPERFSGAIEPIDRVAGHVPGARNLPFASSLDSNTRFLSPAQLRSQISAHQANARDEHTVVMCGSGVTACHVLLAMEVAGKPGARLYAGSWSEWIRDPQRPIATGS